jgi:uncharacterized protein involved in tolerance to divalent cations
MTIYYEVKISAENQEQADTILNSLLEKRLVTGGQFLVAPARFLWKGKVENIPYVTIMTYTTDKHKEAEDFPMMTFIAPDDLNKELRDWIDETLA